ncbi:AMP-binding protein [Niveispirillum fermenti]|uniref:AMP-binding protein n=1 Tax=Niveispirillum fermenti TaxID=1233113 RepID=UPI003A8B8A90
MDMTTVPFREADFMPVDLAIDRAADGSIRLRSRLDLHIPDANIPRAIRARARRHPDRLALAWRGADGAWEKRSFGALADDIAAAAGWLSAHVPAGGTLLIMGVNSHATAVLTYAAFTAGVRVSLVGISYGLAGGNLARLRHVFAKVGPVMAYVDPHPALAGAIDAVAPAGMPVISTAPLGLDRPVIGFDALLATPAAADLDQAIGALDVTAPACLMLTSGSTGLPKVVPLSLTNLAASTAQGMATAGGALGPDGDIVDWLPWHHAAGASVLRIALLEGYSLWVDNGKPMPGLFGETVRNLREVSVGYYNNVPAGYALLADALEQDPVLRRTFYSRMRMMLYGGAGLAQHVYDRLQRMAIEETGHRVHITSGYGMTESTTGCLVTHFPTDKVGIGLPAPGVEVKLVPYDGRYELRLRGPNVMAAYLDDPDRTAAAFDEDGFYRSGDLAHFHDEARPEAGLAFAGRLAEEFKLDNGTWVQGGHLRDLLLGHLAPLVLDLVFTDDNRPWLGLLFWPRPGAPADVLDQVAGRLRDFNRDQAGRSATVARVAMLTTPPNPDWHELSDKGTINRRAVIDHRADIVADLYSANPGPAVRVL